MRRLLAFLALAASSLTCFGQEFRTESELPAITADGFYRVSISPEMTTHLNENFTNVRIIDSRGAEVPYLFQVEKPSYHTVQFKTYTIVEKTQTKGCCTTLVLHNPESEPINNISLSVKNAEITKQATLLGSDDKTNWFALKEHFTFNSINNREEVSEVRIVDFPLSNYSYYKLLINDSINAPINILGAGYFEVSSESGKFHEVITNVSSSDSVKQKRTYIKIKFDTTHMIDKISIKMKGAPYFLRRASINETRERETKKGERERWFNELDRFELSSKGPSVIELPNTKAGEFTVIIENDDNPPLQVDVVEALQLNRYLTAYLKKGETYFIKIGATDLRAPVYDIGYFKDSIPANIVTFKIDRLTMTGEEVEAETSATFFSSRLIIWAAIVLVIVVLGFMAIKMINEASSEKS